MGKSPFDFELRYILRLYAWLGLEPSISQASAPAVPLRPTQIDGSRNSFAAIRIRVYSRARARLFSSQMNREGANLISVKPGGLLAHYAGSQGLDNILGRAAPDQE
jgi:hypothetical protein